MTRHVINTISRTQGADAVFAAAEEMQRSRYAFDESVYNALLQTCFQVWRGRMQRRTQRQPPRFAMG